MATVKFISVPTKRLSASINASSTSIQVSDILGWDAVALTASDFGTKLYCVLRNDNNTQMEIMELDPSTIASASITILLRGLKFNGDLTTEVTANKLTWVKNETLVELGTDVPQLLEHTVRTVGDQTIAGVKTFSSAPISSSDASSANELIRKSQLDAAVFGATTVTPVVISGNGGEVLAVDQLVYLKVSDGEWYLVDADTAATVDNIILGITRGAGTDGASITNGVTLFGEHTAASAIFTANTKYYASNTAGGFSTTTGTTEVTVGYARTTTKLLFNPRYDQQITEDQQDALAGTSGTPSSSNKFVTDADTSGTGAVARASTVPTLKFGGTGADGALTITSGTTTISAASANYLEKNYTSISITGTGVLAFSNKGTNGTVIVLKSQGAVTLTSSATPMIDASGMGASAGTVGLNSLLGTTPNLGVAGSTGGVNGNAGGAAGSAGSAAAAQPYQFLPLGNAFGKVFIASTGAGGGAGGTGGVAYDNGNIGSNAAGGAGGAGGGVLIIECGGALNFTTTSGISVAGAAGSVGSAGTRPNKAGTGGGGGGGGGAGGTCIIFYNTLTASSGSITSSGGAGGAGGSGGTQVGADANGGGGGGGGGGSGGGNVSASTAGSAGQAGGATTSASGGNGGAGGAGSAGQSSVIKNTEFS